MNEKLEVRVLKNIEIENSPLILQGTDIFYNVDVKKLNQVYRMFKGGDERTKVAVYLNSPLGKCKRMKNLRRCRDLEKDFRRAYRTTRISRKIPIGFSSGRFRGTGVTYVAHSLD